MIKEIKSDSGKTYKVDTDKVTCSCADWQYRRRHYPNGSIDHLCKHLRALLEEDPKLFPSEYHQKKDEFDENAVVMDDKIRYPRVMFDSYVKSLKLLAKGGSAIDKYEVCGSYRRLNSLVSDLDLLVTLKDPTNTKSIYEFYNKIKLAYPNHEIKAQGDLKLMIMLDGKL